MMDAIILPYVYGFMILMLVLFVGSVLLPLLCFESIKKKIAGTTVVLLVWALLVDVPGQVRRSQAVDWRNKGIEYCASELDSVTGPYETDGLLVQGGVIGHRALVTMLGTSRLRYVELPVRSVKSERDGRIRHAVSIQDGNYPIAIEAPSDAKYLRLALGQKGHSDCTRGTMGSSLSYPPFLPGVCLLATPTATPSARHELIGIPTRDNRRLIRWTVRDRRSGQVYAALTSSDSPDAPVIQEGGDAKETRRIGEDVVSCRKPYESLMLLARNTETAENPFVLRDVEVFVPPPDFPISADHNQAQALPTIEVAESPVLDWSKEYDRLVVSNTWERAWLEAQRSGWAVYKGALVDARQRNFIHLTGRKTTPESIEVPADKVLATPNGFLWTRRGPNPYTYLAAFSLNGSPLWRVKLKTQVEHPQHIKDFDPIVIHSTGDVAAIYGFRYDQSTKKSAVSVLHVPFKSLSAGVQQ